MLPPGRVSSPRVSSLQFRRRHAVGESVTSYTTPLLPLPLPFASVSQTAMPSNKPSALTRGLRRLRFRPRGACNGRRVPAVDEQAVETGNKRRQVV
jgi:hypothetical protein